MLFLAKKLRTKAMTSGTKRKFSPRKILDVSRDRGGEIHRCVTDCHVVVGGYLKTLCFYVNRVYLEAFHSQM